MRREFTEKKLSTVLKNEQTNRSDWRGYVRQDLKRSPSRALVKEREEEELRH